ncbi:MAG: hypothetical protein IPN13_12355 [Bacteroidetes bacterium]|nr:hypothetical protein [Bacteroidota bacterium]
MDSKANYAGSSGFVAVGFSINDKGYAGTGLSSNNSVYYQDFGNMIPQQIPGHKSKLWRWRQSWNSHIYY